MDTSNRPRAWTDSEIWQLLTGIGPERRRNMSELHIDNITDDDLITLKKADLLSYEKLADIVRRNREIRDGGPLPLVAIGPESCRDLDKAKGFR